MGRLAVSWRVVGLALLCVHASVVNGQAQTLRVAHNQQMSPGAIGHRQLLPGEPLREYYSQPVRITAPGGAMIASYAGAHTGGEYGDLNVGLQVGTVYRFHVSEMANLEDLQLFPSVEVIDRLYPPAGREHEFPIPVELSSVDLRLAAAGKYVTRVIYVEDPEDPFPYDEADPDKEEANIEQRYFEALPGTDPYVVAAGLGRPVAILRMGNRAPSVGGDDHDFAFGSHPVQEFSHVAPSRWKANALSGAPNVSTPATVKPAARDIHLAAAEEPPPARPDSFIPSPIETEVPELESPAVEPPTEDAICIPQIVESPRRQRLSRLEKLFDGGDRFPQARVQQDWNVLGLDAEDTIAHYDTLAGTTEVSASNRVAIYSPRFAAVRQVTNVIQNDSVEPAGRLRMLSSANEQGGDTFADMVKRDEAPIERARDTTPQALQDRNPGLTVDRVDVAKATVGRRPPYSGVQITHTDELFLDRIPLVETYAQELTISNEIQSVQVIVDTQVALLSAKTVSANEVFEYELPDGKARLRIIKIASTTAAQIGDTVRFTIRFDNVGDEAVGNVTVLDNLTTRFVYLPDTQTCDVEATFSSTANQHQSHRLRWEIIDPLEPGQGGTIRFECRVR